MVRQRYAFGAGAEEKPGEGGEEASAPSKESWEQVRTALREGTAGEDAEALTPFGRRRLVYADHTATGRALQPLEHDLQERVLPLYGNVHSLTTATARQSTLFKMEARQLVRQYYNLDSNHAVIFCGAGTTAAVHRFVEILTNASWDMGTQDDAQTWRVEDRWGSIECRLTGVRVKGEAAWRAHCATPEFIEAKRKLEAERAAARESAQAEDQDGERGRTAERRVAVLVDPTAHHSLSLPFREAAKRSAAASGGDRADAAAGHAPAQQRGPQVTVSDLLPDPSAEFGLSLEDLKARIKEARAAGGTALCLLSAASNITGAMHDISAITEMVHELGGLACWDLAGVAGHRRPDLAPSGRPLARVDAAFASPHKFLGGPSTCGILLARKDMLRNPVPAVPGGGSVFFVGPNWHSYITNTEEREEAGSPDLVACARTGLCYHLHASLPRGLVEEHEGAQLRQLLNAMMASPNVEVLAPEACSSGVGTVSFVVRYAPGGVYLHHGFVSSLLNDLFGVQSRAGCACAGPHAQRLLGIDEPTAERFDRALAEDGCEIVRPGFSRVSVHFTDSDAHVAIVRGSICWVAEHGWKLLPHYAFDVETGEWAHRHDTRDGQREWLSALRLPGLAATRKQSEAGGVPPAAPASFEELAALAEAAAAAPAPPAPGAPRLRCPANLVWFALPQDASWTLRHGAAVPSLDPACEPCADAAAGSKRLRVPIFSTPTEKPLSESTAAATAQAGTEPRKFVEVKEVVKPTAEPAAEQVVPVLSGTAAAAPSREPRKQREKKDQSGGRHRPPKPLLRKIHEALSDFDMIMEGDRVLVGLSGGKDSLTLLHCLLEIQRTAPVRFTVAAATVDPQAAGYDPFALRAYAASLGIEYFVLEQPVMERAKEHMDPKTASICSWCSRMKRGALYTCMRQNDFNVLALGQHLDDIAESFLMSAFFNGVLRTMKAHYWAEGSGVRVRVIRPLSYVRESSTAEFAAAAALPIIPENCPACFAAPKERHKSKLLLSSLEFEHKDLFPRLLSTVMPLLDLQTSDNPFQGGLRRQRGGKADADDDACDGGFCVPAAMPRAAAAGVGAGASDQDTPNDAMLASPLLGMATLAGGVALAALAVLGSMQRRPIFRSA